MVKRDTRFKQCILLKLSTEMIRSVAIHDVILDTDWVSVFFQFVWHGYRKLFEISDILFCAMIAKQTREYVGWCHVMETPSALLAVCEGNPLVTLIKGQSCGTLMSYFLFWAEQTVEWTAELLMIWGGMPLMWLPCDAVSQSGFTRCQRGFVWGPARA